MGQTIFLRNPCHRVVFQLSPCFVMADSSEKPLANRLQMHAKVVKIIEHAVTAAPGNQCFDSFFESRHSRRIIAGHADAEQRDPIGINFGTRNQIVDTRLSRALHNRAES